MVNTSPTRPTASPKGSKRMGRTPRDVAKRTERGMRAVVRHEEDILGHIVTWDVAQPTVLREKLVAHAAAHGLTGFAPLPIRPKTGMRRALDTMNNRHLIRLLEDDAERTVYAMVRERITPGDETNLPDVDYNPDLLMVWWKEYGQDPDEALAFTDEAMGKKFRPVVKKYMAAHTGGDVSAMVRAVTRVMDAIALRRNGGVYFVPRGDVNDELLREVRAFLDDLEGDDPQGTYISTFAVPDEEQARDDMRLHVAADLKADIKRLADDIKEKEQTAKDAVNKQHPRSGVQPETVGKYLEQADALIAKASLYADLLTFNAKDINEMIERLRTRLGKLLAAEESAIFD